MRNASGNGQHFASYGATNDVDGGGSAGDIIYDEDEDNEVHAPPSLPTHTNIHSLCMFPQAAINAITLRVW